LTKSISEAEKLTQPESFDHLHLIAEGYSQVWRYAPHFLEAFAFKAAPVAQKVLDAIDTLRATYRANARLVPKDAPISFIKPRWEQHVLTHEGIDRRFYELCAISELKNALRAGGVWVPGSRHAGKRIARADVDELKNLYHSARIFGSHVVLDECRSGE
jgi:hypothetical protein